MYKQILNKKSLSAHSKNKFQTFIFLILEKYDIYFIYLSFFAKNNESTPPDIPPKKKSIFWVWVLVGNRTKIRNQNQSGFEFRILIHFGNEINKYLKFQNLMSLKN